MPIIYVRKLNYIFNNCQKNIPLKKGIFIIIIYLLAPIFKNSLFIIKNEFNLKDKTIILPSKIYDIFIGLFQFARNTKKDMN